MTDPAQVVEIAAPAKLNLWLRVLEKMESGYHSLETLFCAISFADAVRVSTGAPGIRLRVVGPDELGPIERNLAYRAAELVLTASGREAGFDIELLKRIPAAAGLGGGSSDAASVLRAANVVLGNPLLDEDLLRLGLELGSDVPFFLGHSPLALGWGRGERLLSLPPLPSRPVLIAHPGTAMPTGEAFARLAASRVRGFRAGPALLQLSRLSSWEAVAGLAHNDFGEVATEMVPRLRPALATLRDSGAAPALLSGSGAAIFGIFESADARARASARLEALDFRTWTAETLESFPAPQVDRSRTVG